MNYVTYNISWEPYQYRALWEIIIYKMLYTIMGNYSADILYFYPSFSW